MIRYTEVAPAPDLRSHIACFWSLTGDAGKQPAGNRVLPDGCMDVILRFGDEPEARDPSAPLESFVVGAMTSPSVVWQKGSVDVLGVRFLPGAGPAFLTEPASNLTNRVIPLDEFWPEAGEVFERTSAIGYRFEWEASTGAREAALGARQQLRARAEVMQEVLRRRLLPDARDDMVAAAVRLIQNHEGRLRVDDMGTQLGMGARSLERRFRAQTGLAPKLASRIARFQSAAATLQKNPAERLAGLAVHCGYHDQAHMTREFREFAGLTPAAYAAERVVGFVQDTIPAAI